MDTETNAILLRITEEIVGLRSDMNRGFTEMRADMRSMSSDIQELVRDVGQIKEDIKGLRSDIAALQNLGPRIRRIEQHLNLSPEL